MPPVIPFCKLMPPFTLTTASSFEATGRKKMYFSVFRKIKKVFVKKKQNYKQCHATYESKVNRGLTIYFRVWMVNW